MYNNEGLPKFDKKSKHHFNSYFFTINTVCKIPKLLIIAGRLILYYSIHLDPNGDRVTLQNKVLWDVLYYFCQSGKENLEIMKQDWFQVRYNHQTDHDFVVKVCDESTKIHKET